MVLIMNFIRQFMSHDRFMVGSCDCVEKPCSQTGQKGFDASSPRTELATKAAERHPRNRSFGFATLGLSSGRRQDRLSAGALRSTSRRPRLEREKSLGRSSAVILNACLWQAVGRWVFFNGPFQPELHRPLPNPLFKRRSPRMVRK